MQSCKSQEGLINSTHNEAARKIWLLLSHIVANYTETLWDLTGVTTGAWSGQHRNVQTCRRKKTITTFAASLISSTFTICLKFR